MAYFNGKSILSENVTYELPGDTITGDTDPTTSTEASYLGQLYLNTTTRKLFYCVNITTGACEWLPVGTSDNSTSDIAEVITTLNKLNLDEVTSGVRMDVNGGIVSNSSYYTTGKISVSAGQIVKRVATNSDGNRYFTTFRVTAFDEFGNAMAENSIDSNNSSYTVPTGVAFVVLSCGISSSIATVDGNVLFEDSVYVWDTEEEAAQKPTYEPYSNKTIVKKDALDPDVLEEIFNENIEVGLANCEFAEYENLFDDATKVDGYVYTVDGTMKGGTTYVTSDYIKVEPNTEYAFYTNGSGTTGYGFRFLTQYDENKNFIADGSITNGITITTHENARYIRYSVWATQTKTTMVRGTIPNPDAKRVLIIPRKNIEKEQKTAPFVFLPDEIYCAVGRTIEIYNTQVCPSAEKYHIRWVCAYGKALKRKFSITGTTSNIGRHTLTFEVYDDARTLLYSKSAKINVVSSDITSTKSICTIGDSLTNAKYWLKEVNTLSGGNISYVGTRSNTVDGLQVSHEGRSGFSSKSYTTETAYTYENEGVHPFWDATNGKFSWAYYKANSGINPDAVQIYLGANDVGKRTKEEFVANMQTMINDIRSNDANIPIFVVLTICFGNQNGLGAQTSTDGYATFSGVYKYEQDVLVIEMVQALYDATKDTTNIYFVPLTECHDSEYNFGAIETPVNPRATQTELMPSEAVHPQKQGYEQMADIMFSTYCKAFVG